jgi:hypothetical protein
MPDPNSVPFSVTGAATTVVIPAPAATTTLYPQPPYPLGFIRVLGIQITCSATGTITVKSTGSSYGADRTLDTIQCIAGVPIVLQDASGPGFGGQYDCDPGAALTIINSAGNISGHVRYTVLGVP